jgi:hypothetical protein
MFNLKNISPGISNEELSKYEESLRLFNDSFENVRRPTIETMGRTLLQKARSELYLIGNRLQEISVFPQELTSPEIKHLNKLIKNTATNFDDNEVLPEKIRIPLFKRLMQLLSPAHINRFGKKLVKLSFWMHRWHLRYEKNQPEAASGSN